MPTVPITIYLMNMIKMGVLRLLPGTQLKSSCVKVRLPITMGSYLVFRVPGPTPSHCTLDEGYQHSTGPKLPILSALPQHRRIYDTFGEICAPIFGSYFFISFLVEPLSQKGWKLLNYDYESMSVKMAKMFGRWIKNRTHFAIAYCIHIQIQR